MAEFLYQAKSGPKEVVTGKVSASTKQEAVRLIEAQGFIPIEVEESEARSEGRGAKSEERRAKKAEGGGSRVEGGGWRFGRRVSVYQICIFTRQLAGFMRAQVPLLSALEFIKGQTPAGTPLRRILSKAADDVREGRRFSEALQEAGSPEFDVRYISMVKAGESGGSLDAILETLADHLENEEELRGQIRAALAYPALIITVGLGTVFFLFTFAVPRMAGLFRQTFNTLPLPTKILLSLSRPGWQAVFFTFFAAFAGGGIFLFIKRRQYRKLIDAALSRVPLLGTVRLKSDVARFSSTLAMLIKNGIPIYQAIEITRPVLSNETLKEELKDAQSRIMGGEMLAHILEGLRHFPPFVAQMIAVGEDSGRLAESLQEVSRFYSRESLRGVKMMTSLIEPIFILLLSLVVGFVVAGIMLPIFDMNWIK